MFETSVDLQGNDLVWLNKPELPVADEENRKLEEELRKKKIEVERLKIIVQNNIGLAKQTREHIDELRQTLSFKQQMYRTKEHELEMEVHAYKVLERECSRLQHEIKIVNQEIKTLKEREKLRETRIAEQLEKRDKLKSEIQWDEKNLLMHLEKSAQMEKDNMALLKYSSEDDSKINELGLLIEKHSKECFERKNALDDANTEVFIVQSELDRMQEEFQNAYTERSNIISNWEKVMQQIQQRNSDIKKLSERMTKMKDEETQLKRMQKEQFQLLSSETARNDELERNIREKDNLSTKLRNAFKDAQAREENLKAELSTVKNTSNYLLYQKQIIENNLKQLDKQLNQKSQRLEEVNNMNKKLENDIEALNKETFEADHCTKELENLLARENAKNIQLQKNIDNLSKEILKYSHEIKNITEDEKHTESLIKNLETEQRNLDKKIAATDRLRTKQESEMYEIESKLEKLQLRIKKMAGVTNEEEKRQMEAERSQLLSILDEKKTALNMLTEELKVMMERITLSTKELENNRKLNSELVETIKSLEFYVFNSQKTLKCCISRKQELLVQECLLRFQVKRYQKILNNRNKSVFSLQKDKVEFETMMKERIEELKSCTDVLDAEIRTEQDEDGTIKRKLHDCDDKVTKLQTKYKVIMDALGVSEPGESAEAEMLLKAEDEKRDLQHERDKLISKVFENADELSALKNTLWVIDAANEQFRESLHPPGISLEDSEILKKSEIDGQAIAIELHESKKQVKALEERIEQKREELKQKQKSSDEFQDIMLDRQNENEMISKEIAEIQAKIQRADKTNSRLSLEVKNKSDQPDIEEDIRIYLLREIRRTVSDLLFAAVENKPEIFTKVHDMFQEANLPLPSRARSSLSRHSSISSLNSRSTSRSSNHKSNGSQRSNPSSGRQGSSESVSPSIITLGADL
ncbi:coiled-coil domain-containing protein 39-like [Uloborus diversus]|uniref:coiled-coil domain-containing protein 39-like n=1 Tax=Uloborus diversus TaxID=327109 RepID=UPI002409EE87|nr:coiled-coil domain-containing protein 39-like [Uloborus diversus]